MDPLLQLYASHPFWVWMALAAALLAVEIMTGSVYLLWPAGSAAVTAMLTGLHLSPPEQLGIFAGLTIVATIAARRFWPNPLRPKGPDINDAHARIVGHHGQAAEAFTDGHGRVFVDGKEWAAELEGGGDVAQGAALTVTGVLSGACLKVRPA